MKTGIIIAVIVIAVVLVCFFAIYNSFIKLNNSVEEAFATMDVYLKKRWDLIPNLVSTVKGYAKHEAETLLNVIEARNTNYSSMSAEDKLDANAQLSKGLAGISVVAEQYPDLKANQNFIHLSNELSQAELDIANARKYYNAVVKKYNDKVAMFPSNLVAAMFHFTKKQMFVVEEAAQRENVKVEF